MSATRDKFIEACDEIVKAKPEYKLGCSDKKQCDCIGMVKFGLRKCGVTLSTTGTNWTMRSQVTNVRPITSANVLLPGDVVFKSRNPGESGYNLPAKYQKGGSAYNGDLTDYCHIGVVKSVSPLRIIHMTSPTAKTDTVIGKWKEAANLKSTYLDGGSSDKPVVEPVEPTPCDDTEYAVVTAEKGHWVKMRAEPSTKCRLYDEIVVGARVKIVARGYEWTKISYGKRKGWYMMTKFLAPDVKE